MAMTSLEGKRVLVTGGTGFIGGRLVERLVLEEKAQVRVLVRSYSSASRVGRFGVELVRGAITDAEAVEQAVAGCEVVFHLAFEFTKPPDMTERNVAGTENLMKACLKHGAQMVHTSTVDVYGSPQSGSMNEDAPRKATQGNAYAEAKIAVEEIVMRYHREHGLPVVVLQPAIVYGPYCRPWTIGIASNLLGEKPVALIDGGAGVCHAVYVDDVVSAMLLSVGKEAAYGQAFLIGGPETITWRELYDAFESAVGRQNTVAMSVDDLYAPPPKPKPEPEPKLAPQQVVSVSNANASLLGQIIDRDMLNRVRQTPGVGFAYKVVRFATPHGLWTRLKSRAIKSSSRHNKPPAPPAPPRSSLKSAAPIAPQQAHVVKPPPFQAAMYTSRATLDLTRAREVLGYTPDYDLKRGMAVTAEFLRWANLTADEQA